MEGSMGGDHSITPCGKLCLGLKIAKPYLAMVSLQIGYAGLYVIAMLSMKHGMSHFVLAVYRNAVATLTIAPFAFVLERYPPLLSFLHTRFVHCTESDFIQRVHVISDRTREIANRLRTKKSPLCRATMHISFTCNYISLLQSVDS